MDRNREARRGSMAAANGLSKRRHRSSSLRDSPEEDGAIEFPETARLRDRVNKKDRDRSSRSKRRRGDRLMQGSNREEGEESTDESVDDDEEDEDEVAGAVRMLPPNPVPSSFQSNHHLRKSVPPAKVVRAAPWKVSDEMGFSVPKKARSASAKRSQECWISGGGGGGGGSAGDGEQAHRQAITSPARPSVMAPSPSPVSPSSSSASVRKKMKHIGPKHRLPKMNKPSSIDEEIEIEVAEVLFGMMRQPDCPSRQEIIANYSQKLDSKDTNGSSNDAKSRVSSPISVSPPSAPQPSMLPQNSISSTAHLPVVAPKRKRPRPVKIEDESSAIFTVGNCSNPPVAKIESDRPAKVEISSPKSEKSSRSPVENGEAAFHLGSSHAAAESLEPQPKSGKPEGSTDLDSKPLTVESKALDGVQTKEDVSPAREEYPPCAKLDVDLEGATVKKSISAVSEGESHREDMFKIDLMAIPPLKSSPERDGVIDLLSGPKPLVLDVEMAEKTEIVAKEEEKSEKFIKQDAGEAGLADKMDVMATDFESQKLSVGMHKIPELQIDLEKPNKDSVGGSTNLQLQKKQQQQSRIEPKFEKAVQSSSLPLSMNVAGWPGGLPLGYSMGQVRPLPGIVPLDGSAGTAPIIQPPQFLLSQPRLKKCATHFYIAQNIHYLQQFTKMSPFWPAAAGSAPLYANKPYNLNVVPRTETAVIGNQSQGGISGRNFNSLQDKGQVEVTLSSNVGKDKSSTAANFADAVQRKQLVLQQAPQPVAAGNLLAPAFIFPLSHQQAAAAAAAAGTRSGAVKSASAIASVVSSVAANSSSGSSSTTAAATSTVSFNYPNLPANDAQYLAILQNNGYPYPFPPPVGAPPPYRGESHPQAIPFFSGSFYPSQMPHPSQLQQQQKPQQQSHSQPQPIQQGHPNPSTSSGSSSSQKHQQQQLQGGGTGADCGVGNTHRFPVSKNRQQQLQKQQNQSITLPHQVYQFRADMAVDDCSLAADCRVSQAHKNIYGQNFSMPIHPKNCGLMSPAALVGCGSGNHGEKQQQRLSQQQSLKGGMELAPSQAFTMSCTSISGAATASGLDFSSMAQNHAFFQSVPEAFRNGKQIAAQATPQKKTHQISEGKAVSDSVNSEDERKSMTGKGVPGVGQAHVFSRPDSTDQSASTIPGNSATENSARPASGNRASRSNTSAAATTTTPPCMVSTPNSQHQQQQQLIHLQKQQLHLQQQFAAVPAASQTKPSTNSRASVYSDHVPSSSSMVAKFPNAHTVFPQGFIQAGSSVQSPQWKNPTRSTASPVSSHSLTSTTSSLKNVPQQHVRNEQVHMQISFGVNPKSGTPPQGQPLATGNHSASPVIVGSPPTSISKGSGGSPRTTSTGSKVGPTPTLSSQQQVKNSPSGPSRKSSPVGGKNVPSILGNSHVMGAPGASTKSLSQQQIQNHTLQHAQFFSNYMQAQSPQSTTAPPASVGYYHQRRQPEQPQQQKQGPLYASTGMLSLCPSLTLTGATTSDPAKAVAATANNMKGGLASPGLLQAVQFATQSGGNPHPFMSNTFSYMHSVPAAQVKPAEQKQPTGNDNLRASSQPEKR